MSLDDEEPEYWLNRNYLASARLTYQHDLYSNTLGYLLHPTISEAHNLKSPNSTSTAAGTTTPPLQILDLATGNGIWALALAQQHPQHQITGLDISAAMLPHPASLPSNLTFGTWDIMTPPPAHLLDKFNIIHIRFIMPILWRKPSQRETAIAHFTQLLKPGGWLQWMEPRPPVWVPVTFLSDGRWEVAEEADHAHRLVDKYIPISAGQMWVRELDKVLEELGGYERTELGVVRARRDQLMQENVLMRWNLGEGIPNLLKAMKEVLPEDAREEIAQAFKEEFEGMDKGERLFVGSYVLAVGRKPLEGS